MNMPALFNRPNRFAAFLGQQGPQQDPIKRGLEQIEEDVARLDREIKNAQDDVADAAGDEGRRLAAEKIAQLQEVKVALGF